MNIQKPSPNKKQCISPVIRLKKDTAEALNTAACTLRISNAKAVDLAIQHWLMLTPSAALGISKNVLYYMAELEGVKIDA